MENGLDYEDEPRTVPPGRLPGKRRERKGSLAFISDSLPSLPTMPSMPSMPNMPSIAYMPQIPAMLMPVMPANFKMPGFGGAQQQRSSDDDSDDDDSSDDASSSSGSRSRSTVDSKSKKNRKEKSESDASSSSRSVSHSSTSDRNKENDTIANASEPRNILDDDDDDTTSTADDESSNRPQPKVAATHTKAVGRMRKIVVLIILFAAVLITLYTYKVLVEQNKSDLEAVVGEAASIVINQARNNLDLKVSSAIVLSDYVTKLVDSSSWPLASIPQYESRASVLRLTTNTESVTFLPIVAGTFRQDWQTYSQSSFLTWYNESIMFLDQTRLSSIPTINSYIFGPGGTSEIGEGPYLPVWQTSPPNTNVSGFTYNLDLFSQDVGPIIRRALAEKRTSVEPVLNVNTDQLSQYALNLDKLGKDDIYSALYTPIFKPGNGKVVVGVLMTVHGWKSLFGGMNNSILTSSAMCPKPYLDCVVTVPNGDMYTISMTTDYEMSYAKGDRHDGNYDEYAEVFIVESEGVSGNFTVTFYPTSTMASYATSSNPTIYTTIVALLFFLVLCLFCTFNFAVEKRHRVIMRRLKLAASTLTSQNLSKSFQLQSKGIDEEDVEKAPLRKMSSNNKPSDESVSSKSSASSRRSSSSKKSASSHKSSSSKKSTSSHKSSSSNESRRSSSHRNGGSLLGSRNNDSSHSDDDINLDGHTTHSTIKEPPKAQMKQIMAKDEKCEAENGQTIPGLTMNEGKPIADLFLNCTVLFADIIGFNAWSSSRDPIQVFTLLQGIYEEFDKAAKIWGALKVETIGDSYVAVTGLPEPQNDHALRMASFALECRKILQDVTRSLERELGPDTSDELCLRVGLNSGQVTAGLLRGEKHRFQLFGDTVNIASRMESSGQENLIQLSKSTATLLKIAGKGDWLLERQGTTCVGETFWLERKSQTGRRLSVDASYFAFSGKSPSTKKKNSLLWSASTNMGSLDTTTPQTADSDVADSTSRLVDWNVEILWKLLRQVVAYRISVKKLALRRASMQTAVNQAAENVYLSENTVKGLTVVDAVTHAVQLPNFDPELVMEAVDPSTVEIDKKVQKQLKQFVQVIAGTYLPNPFHNYEHAVHVQMSTMKLLSRVKSPEHIDFNGDSTTVASDAHDYTYGITSDPITQFCVVFAGLCHDCAHTGVPNSQLVKEKANVATIYGNKSVAEQNSVDLAWSLLMNNDYKDLRECIYSNESEFKRFRQLMVNLIVATDLFDKQLNQLQKKRWNVAFNGTTSFTDPSEEVNRKATIVVEYLIQASDIAHTMQHWKIYKKWNGRLFREMYDAYDSGRTETDPSIGWYRGELWFFDNYVIPLAKKLKECRVFGVSSDECLNYATENRATWASEGEKIVSEWAAAAAVAST